MLLNTILLLETIQYCLERIFIYIILKQRNGVTIFSVKYFIQLHCGILSTYFLSWFTKVSSFRSQGKSIFFSEERMSFLPVARSGCRKHLQCTSLKPWKHYKSSLTLSWWKSRSKGVWGLRAYLLRTEETDIKSAETQWRCSIKLSVKTFWILFRLYIAMQSLRRASVSRQLVKSLFWSGSLSGAREEETALQKIDWVEVYLFYKK